jgi:serine/threonine protein phosphatase PrpC
VVSPEPDVGVISVEVGYHRCLVFGTDGLWNMLSPNAAVAAVQEAEQHNEKHVLQHHNSAHVRHHLRVSQLGAKDRDYGVRLDFP